MQITTYIENKKSLLNEDAMIRPYNDKIFEDLGKKLSMTAKAVHWAVTRNADAIFGIEQYKIAETKPIIKDTGEDVDYLFDGGLIINIQNQQNGTGSIWLRSWDRTKVIQCFDKAGLTCYEK